MYYSIKSISTYSWHAAIFYLHNQDSYFFWHFWKTIEWRNIEMELKFGIMLPFPLFSCQGGNVRNRKLNGPQVMVSSYLADTEVYLVGSWKNGAGAYGFHTPGNHPVICTLPPAPSIPRSGTRQKQDDKSGPCTPPVFPELVFCTRSLGRRMQTSVAVGNETASNAHIRPSSLKSETSAQCEVWSTFHKEGSWLWGQGA